MKKSKIILWVVLLAINLLLIRIFKIKITFQQVLILQSFLFSLSFLGEKIQLKFSKNKKVTPAHFLMINLLRILLCVMFLLPTILKYSASESMYIYNFFIVYFIYLFHDVIFRREKQNKINV